MSLSRIKKDIELIKLKIQDYEDGDVALTKTELKNLYNSLHQAEEALKTECPHDNAILYKFHYDDEYSTMHSQTGCMCLDCNKTFFGWSKGKSDHAFTKPMPILELVQKHRREFQTRELKEMGIEEHEHVTRTYTYNKIGGIF